MIKKRFIAATMAALMLFGITTSAYAKWDYAYEGITTKNITKGVIHKNYQYLLKDSRLADINVMEIDLTQEHLKMEVLHDSRGMSYRDSANDIMAGNPNAIVAVNGDFFAAKSGDVNRATAVGSYVKDGTLLSSPSVETGMATMAQGLDNKFIFDVFTMQYTITAPNGKTENIGSVNKFSSLSKIAMYTPEFGEFSQGGSIIQMKVVDNIVTEILYGTDPIKIPENGYILSVLTDWSPFLRDNFKVGDPVALTLNMNYDPAKMKTAIGGGSILVKNGATPATFPHAIATGYTARTAAGVNDDSTKLYLVTVDTSTATSGGLTLSRFSEFLISIGVHNAINLDGGGSTTMLKRDVDTNKISLANTPSDKGVMRLIPNLLGITSSAVPQGVIRSIIATPEKSIGAIDAPTKIAVSGYDDFLYPVAITDTNEVRYAVSGVEGYFWGNEFHALTSGVARITATYQGMTATTQIMIDDNTNKDPLDHTGKPAIPSENIKISLGLEAGMKQEKTLFDKMINERLVSAVSKDTTVNVYIGGFTNKSLANKKDKVVLFGTESKLHSAGGNAFMTLNSNASGAASKSELATFASNMNQLAFEQNFFIFTNNNPLDFNEATQQKIVLDIINNKAKQGKNVFVVYPGAEAKTTIYNGVRYISMSQTPYAMNAENFLTHKDGLKTLQIDIDKDNQVYYRFEQLYK